MLCPHDRSLNFSENIGSSATSSSDMITTKMNKYKALKWSDTKKLCAPTVSEPQNNALAGVGIPIKEEVCRSSKLNLANRKAEKTAIRKAV